MSHVLTLVAAEGETLSRSSVELAEEVLLAIGASIGDAELLGPDAVEVMFEASMPELVEGRIRRALDGRRIDVLAGPVAGRRKKLLLADMDSTMITVECIDELADFAGVGDKVRDITERAMRGEIDFEGALIERVGLLKGLSVDVLDEVFRTRITLSPGARIAIMTMRMYDARCALVSGGFTFFTERVAEQCGFHFNRANVLKSKNGKLTGEVEMPILGKQAKLDALHEHCRDMAISTDDALCIGDGANDLAMIQASGLGIAYRAKPVTAEAARARIEYGGLKTLLYYQGYHRSQFCLD